jgi:hypothetical protein
MWISTVWMWLFVVANHGQYIVSILTVGMARHSTTKCCIQTIMINVNSHGHGMYLPMLIKFLSFSLKCYFISKTGECFRLTLTM